MPVVTASATQAYSRKGVQRLLGISERQLRNWEKRTFVAPADTYAFSDLLALRTLAGLAKAKISTGQIHRALTALRVRLQGIRDPLTELKLYPEGRKIRVQFAGSKMEPLSGQLLLDFDRAEFEKMLAFPPGGDQAAIAPQQRRRIEAERWFERGLELEQAGASIEEVILAYQKAVELDPSSPGALVNLGTVYFNVRAWRDAERNYRKALEVDPEYALAHFNLGNLLDEKGDRAGALAHYQSALQLHPGYADAHYNTALLYQATGQTLKAVQHWKAYLKIDPSSTWAAIARRELAKLRDSAIVRGTRD